MSIMERGGGHMAVFVHSNTISFLTAIEQRMKTEGTTRNWYHGLNWDGLHGTLRAPRVVINIV